MLSAQARYQNLLNKAHGRSFDPGRGLLYSFPKYCLRCNQGLKKPKLWDRKSEKRNFRSSFCSENCREVGERFGASQSVRAPHKSSSGYFPAEELAFVALEIVREEKFMSPRKRLVRQAHHAFSLLSEKLSFLEAETGEPWYRDKFTYWLTKAK